ncbi:hypothetical protein GCK72_001565 [Caenorhabditis remanei]|uniref:PAN-3 domain-containing protein n=1 Tax=Caenorhabditis remanei TaxID=31234 RepID=A0A6A5HPB0_CAERE|nr:hypothetical protein GCK72_001565 [Caenorhabditis remanei]KAF1769748.1 hypothetical protein GCK72_001565 [Caenorhabditis remanei]
MFFFITSFLIVFSICLIGITNSSTLIVTNGSPVSYSSYSSLTFDWDGCLDYCVNDEMCMVIFNNGSDTTCQLFKIGDLQSVKRRYSSEVKVAFKLNKDNSSTCPANDTLSGGGYVLGYNDTLRRQSYHGYSITYDPENLMWNFNSTGVTMCASAGYKMSIRPKGPWCFYLFNTGAALTTQEEAAYNCSVKWSGVLSGLDTPEEFQAVTVMAKNHGYDFSSAENAAWIDGIRKSECVGNTSCSGLSAFTFSDPTLSSEPTGFLWNSNQPDGTARDCLIFKINSDKSYGIDDNLCTMRNSTIPKMRLSGYLCGEVPKVR